MARQEKRLPYYGLQIFSFATEVVYASLFWHSSVTICTDFFIINKIFFVHLFIMEGAEIVETSSVWQP